MPSSPGLRWIPVALLVACTFSRKTPSTGTDDPPVVGDTTTSVAPDTDDTPAVPPPTGTVTAVRIDDGGDDALVEIGTTVDVAVDFTVATDPACADCVVQVVLGLDGEAIGCLYEDAPTVAGVSESGTLPVTAPSEPGTGEIQVVFLQTASCGDALAAFEATSPSPAATVGTLRTFADPGYGDLRVHEQTWNVRSGGGCIDVDCPGGRSVLSYGVEEVDRRLGRIDGEVLDANTVRFCGAGSLNYRLQLTCGTPTTTNLRSNTFPAPGGSGSTYTTRTLTRTCDAGTQPTGYSSVGWPPYGISLGFGRDLDGSFVVYPAAERAVTDLNLTAICASTLRPTRVTDSTSVPPGGDACATATCPSDWVVIGGGHGLDFGGQIFDNAIYRHTRIGVGGNSWKACLSNDGSTVTRTVTSEAWCLPRAPRFTWARDAILSWSPIRSEVRAWDADRALWNITGGDPWLLTGRGLALDARYRTIEVTIDNQTTGNNAQILFRRPGESFGGDRVVTLPLVPGTSTYTFDMGGNPEWTGTIEELRFDLTDASSGYLVISPMEVSQ